MDSPRWTEQQGRQLHQTGFNDRAPASQTDGINDRAPASQTNGVNDRAPASQTGHLYMLSGWLCWSVPISGQSLIRLIKILPANYNLSLCLHYDVSNPVIFTK